MSAVDALPVNPLPFNLPQIDEKASKEQAAKSGNFFLRGVSKFLKKNPKALFKTTSVAAVGASKIVQGLETPAAVAGSLAGADKVFKVLQVPSVLEMWFTYDYSDIGNTRKMKPLIFLRDIASTISAIPQMLDRFGLITLASLGESLGKVPVIGGLAKLPGTYILGGLEIFVYLSYIAVSLKKLVEIGIGAHKSDIEQKVALWTSNPQGIFIDLEMQARFQKKVDKIKAYQLRYYYELIERNRTPEQARGIIDRATATLFEQKARKWEIKQEMIWSSCAREVVNVLFYATLIAISILLLCAVSGVALTILAGCLLLFGAYRIIDDVVNVPPSVKPSYYLGS